MMVRIDASSLEITRLPMFNENEPECWQATVHCMRGETIDTGTGVHGVIWRPGEVTACGKTREEALCALGNRAAALNAIA